MDKIFTNSLDKYKGLYYHFLDGYLNPDSGSFLLDYKNMLKENKLFHFDYTLIYLSYDDIFDIHFLLDNNSEQFILDDVYIILDFEKIFKYCIFQTVFNNHAISLLFRIEGNQLIVGCVNSGQGIEKFPELYYNKSNEYCLPFINYILLNNIDNLEDKKIIYSILCIPILFSLIGQIQLYIEDTRRHNYYKLKLFIIKYIDYVKILLDSLCLTFADIGFNLEDSNTHINILDNYTTEFSKWDTSKMLSYYEIIINIFSKFEVKKYKFGTKFNTDATINLNENIKNNVILHNIDGTLYIKPQQSGSCSWFSLYWCLLFYNIYNDNEEQYNKLIQDIYDFYYKKIQEIFIYDNFNKEDENLILMKIICNKFLDLNLLENKNILKDKIDFIYDNEIFIHSKNIKDNIKNNKILKEITNINISIIYNNIIFYFYNNLDDNILEKITEFYILSYRLYNYCIETSTNFFKVNSSISNLNEIKADNLDLYNKFIKLNKLISEQPNYSDYQIFRYIAECKYIIYYYNSINSIPINELYILNFCIFTNKFKLFIEIYDDIFKISKSKSKPKYNKISYLLLPILNDFTTCDTFDTTILTTGKGIIFDFQNMFNNYSDYYYNKFYLVLPIIIDENFYLLGSNLKVNIEDYERTYEDYEKLLIFLFQHPKYIFTSFNNENYIINNCNFIKFNIYQIFENEEYRNNLIVFFASRYYELYDSKNDLELFYIIANLQLLITKYLGYYDFSNCKIHEIKMSDSIYEYMLFEYSTINFENFKILIDKIYFKYKKENKKEEFRNYLKDTKTELVKSYLVLLKKHFININKIDDYTINIDEIIYYFIDPTYNLVLDLFNVNNETLFLYNIDQLYIYIISFENKIKLILNKDNKIDKIIINDCEVFKYQDLNEVFKYVIPTTCLHLIYKINDEYNITYFVNNKYTSNLDILGKCPLTTNTYNISINKNNMMFPNKNCFDNFSKLCINFEINNFNILYLNTNMINEKNTLLCYNKKVEKLFNFNKTSLKEPLKNDIKYIKLNFIKNIEKYKRFLIKISRCNVINLDKILIKLEYYLAKCNYIKDEFYFNFHDKNIKYLFDNYDKLYNYLLNIKIINFFTVLKNIILKKDSQLIISFCSQTKIFNDYFNTKKYSFNYKFEALFELISGNELLEEQMNRYIDIIEKYTQGPNKYNVKKYLEEEYNILYNQDGGNYPLHHFMMGKGKSAIMTPMLSLYFSIVHNKNIIIIIPSHLEKQTHKTMDEIIHIFDLSNKIKILTDTTIKKYYLADVFLNNDNTDTVMLIDEFDSILDPMKSNFNIINEKEKSNNLLFNLLKPNFTESIKEQINFIKSGNINIRILKDETYEKLVLSEIKNIKEQLENETLSENINWGVHPLKGYAIPYRSKGNPLLNSNFSSSVLTVYLTLYYYLVIENYNLSDLMVNYIIYNSLLDKLFNIEEPQIVTYDFINNLISTDELKINFFNKLLEHIFINIEIPINRYNSSFVDILNIHGIYKIGYSGTINIDLPPLSNPDKFTKDDIVVDPDESLNIEYAILNSKSYLYNQKNIFDIVGIELDKYSAIIDTVGFYKYRLNENVAEEIYNKFNKKRDVIYIDETDNIYAFVNNKKIIYNSNDLYKSPFIYYSQSHIIGIDIKQDNYPIMKGLCLIDENSYYSQIAQAMFRLRKLNIGHSIDFINMKKHRKKKDIILYLKVNEDNNNKSKNKYLLYQTLKSEIRNIKKSNKEGNIFININDILKNEIIHYNEYHLEKIKYYYNEYSDKLDIILNGIIDNKDIENEHNKQLFEKINKSFGTLVYNINSSQQDQDQQKEQDQQIIILLHDNEKLIKEIFLKIEYKKYDFNNIKTLETFKISTIKISEKIRCLPNLFSQLDTYNYINNKSGFLFVYIYELLLLIPGYLLVKFDEYPLLTLNLKLINDKIITDDTLSILKNNNIYKIFTSNDDILIDNETVIGSMMLSFYNNITKIQSEILKNDDIINPSNVLLITDLFNDFYLNNKALFITNNYDETHNKYLKYKLKYLKLKNKI
jgi:hypothetical protein